MQTVLEALYQYALETHDPDQWSPDPDFRSDYHMTLHNTEDLLEQLNRTLDPSAAVLFRKFLDSTKEENSMDRESLFLRGVAIGLQLVSLTQRL